MTCSPAGMTGIRRAATAFMVSILLVGACTDSHDSSRLPSATSSTAMPSPSSTIAAATRDPLLIAARATVPVLCYHQIREWRVGESELSRGLTTPPALFAEQMAFLAENGFHPVSPADYYDHLVRGVELPTKPVMLTFDDGHISQMTVVPVLQKYGFTATFFLMTVVIGKPNWIKTEQIRELDAMGYTIGAHTYDHQNLAKFPAAGLLKQVVAPRQRLEAIIGHPIRFFAYPFGAWNTRTLTEMGGMNFDAAFQLGDHELDATHPLMTLRRQIANPLTGMPGFRRQVSPAGDLGTGGAPNSPSSTRAD